MRWAWMKGTPEVASGTVATGSIGAKAEKSRLLRLAMNRREFLIGSNEWGVAAAHTEGGHPIIANDPHLSLGMPSTFYEIHLVVADDPVDGPMNVSGATFPGAPAVILGQNERITWGATTNGMDVTDLFIDRMVRLDPDCPNTATFGLCIVSEGSCTRCRRRWDRAGLRVDLSRSGILCGSAGLGIADQSPGGQNGYLPRAKS